MSNPLLALPARSWRHPLTISLCLHVLAMFAFWLIPTPRSVTPFSTLAESQTEDADFLVMDIEPPTRSLPQLTPALIASSNRSAATQAANDASSTGSASTPTHIDKPVVEPTGGTSRSANSHADSASQTEGESTTFFEVAAQGNSVVFVLDGSGSMGAFGRMGLARQELARSLERLPESAAFQIVLYHRRAETLIVNSSRGLLAATGTNKQSAIDWVNAHVPEGATDHLPALRLALQLQPDVIFFLTDADDLRMDQVHALMHLNRNRTSIHTIELNGTNRGNEKMPLQQLARENRGTYRAVDVNLSRAGR